MVVCPHCKAPRIFSSKVPKDVVMVLPCPACHELVVLFRRKVVPIDRKILEKGEFEERKAHIAEVIAEFLEPGMFRMNPDDLAADDEGHPFFSTRAPGEEEAEEDDAGEAISQSEFERFVKIDLNRLDEARYFKKHFGGSS